MNLMEKIKNQNVYAQLDENFFLAEEGDESHNMLLRVLDSFHDGVLIINTQAKVCYVNESYARMFGVSREKMIGRCLSKFEPFARILDVLTTQKSIVGDISHIHSASMDVCANIAPLFAQEQLIGAVGQIRNVTEMVRAGLELEHFKSLTRHLKTELSSKEDLPPPLRNVLGHSPAFINTLRMAAKAAKSDVNVCICGESGVGKEVVAEALHYSSNRAEGPLVKINCASIPETLLESELFGYEHGAFTGARSGGKKGKFELAEKGTIFLDEIGDMPLSMQVKLLRVLQDKKVERVGGVKSIQLDFRLITATNKDLLKCVEEGTFREDLYYRIDVIHLNISPLRERKEDILLYSNIFLEEMSELYGKQYNFSPEVVETIKRYHWPGNVRELRNCIEQASVMSMDEIIGLGVLPPQILAHSRGPQATRPNTYKLNELLNWTEREAILAALRMTGNNKTKAIEILGISRRSFYQKIEKYNLRS